MLLCCVSKDRIFIEPMGAATFGKYSYSESAHAPKVKVADGNIGPVVSTVQGQSPGIRVLFCAWSK